MVGGLSVDKPNGYGRISVDVFKIWFGYSDETTSATFYCNVSTQVSAFELIESYSGSYFKL